MTVEIMDYNSPVFAKTVLVRGRECQIVRVDAEYTPTYGRSFYDRYSHDDRYMYISPDVDIRMTVRQLPPPPPPTPKRTWTSAMGLRRPTR